MVKLFSIYYCLIRMTNGMYDQWLNLIALWKYELLLIIKINNNMYNSCVLVEWATS
jgi:hypothetical protein